ncbi:unnamed protein product, partial [Discosporangium mesarthrocarpum]
STLITALYLCPSCAKMALRLGLRGAARNSGRSFRPKLFDAGPCQWRIGQGEQTTSLRLLSSTGTGGPQGSTGEPPMSEEPRKEVYAQYVDLRLGENKFPEGLAGRADGELIRFCAKGLGKIMRRAPATAIIDSINKFRQRSAEGQRAFLVTGVRGAGKSCVLNDVVLHARMNGWVVVFVPDSRSLLHKGIYCRPSPVFKGMYDLPKQSIKMLESLKSAHSSQLGQISIHDPEV